MSACEPRINYQHNYLSSMDRILPSHSYFSSISTSHSLTSQTNKDREKRIEETKIPDSHQTRLQWTHLTKQRVELTQKNWIKMRIHSLLCEMIPSYQT